MFNYSMKGLALGPFACWSIGTIRGGSWEKCLLATSSRPPKGSAYTKTIFCNMMVTPGGSVWSSSRGRLSCQQMVKIVSPPPSKVYAVCVSLTTHVVGHMGVFQSAEAPQGTGGLVIVSCQLRMCYCLFKGLSVCLLLLFSNKLYF